MGPLTTSVTTNFPPPKLSMNSEVQHLPLYKSEFFLHQKYVLEGLSISEIATQIFSSRAAVAATLKRHDIPIRPADISNKNRAQLGYGQAWQKHSIIQHKRELAAIEKMKTLRAQGFSYWKIADVFNSMKVPTKTGRGKWHARSVQQILDRLSGTQISSNP